MGIFQFPCPLGFAIILQGSGSSRGGFSFGVAPPGMIYITILSLLAPLVTAGVKGFGIIFSVSWDLNGNGHGKRVGFDHGKYEGTLMPKMPPPFPQEIADLKGWLLGSRCFFCEPSSLLGLLWQWGGAPLDLSWGERKTEGGETSRILDFQPYLGFHDWKSS